MFVRACRAYFMVAGDPEPAAPTESLSGIKKIKGKRYVVLANAHRTLAVYRVRNDGMLKRLRRWPAELNG